MYKDGNLLYSIINNIVTPVYTKMDLAMPNPFLKISEKRSYLHQILYI